MTTKQLVKKYWDTEPCGTRNIPYPVGSFAYFEDITQKRNQLEPFIANYAQFEKWFGKNVLEVGCGVGSDLLRFARYWANVTGIDLSPKSISLTQARFKFYGYQGDIRVADAEKLPFRDEKFALSYSWGVLHHTPNIQKAINEIYRVTKRNGEICVMLYHQHSLVALQMYLKFGLFALKPFRKIEDILANCHESLGTKAYTVAGVKQMFSKFKDLDIKVQLTPYDLRYGEDKYLPRWVGRLVPSWLGWFIVVRGGK